MKTKIIFLIIFILLCSCSQKPREKFFLEYDGEIISVGDSVNILQNIKEQCVMGKEELDCGGGEGADIFTYQSIRVSAKDGKIINITLLSDIIKTPEGIYIGSAKEEVIKAYGEDYKAFGESVVYICNDVSLSFVISGGIVTSVYYELI